MTDLEKIELAIRRAASQMPNGASRTFRLLADELSHGKVMVKKTLDAYRDQQRHLD